MEAPEDRHMSGVFLYGGPEKPLYEAVNVKLRLSCRPQNVGDARVLGHLPIRNATRVYI